ncbi:hypothetical protein HK104_010853 [Borealophlyctis nickersoniae]|nr:hypothetical protein HK104_010853 [Borealophlyctis nickersoniae]
MTRIPCEILESILLERRRLMFKDRIKQFEERFNKEVRLPQDIQDETNPTARVVFTSAYCILADEDPTVIVYRPSPEKGTSLLKSYMYSDYGTFTEDWEDVYIAFGDRRVKMSNVEDLGNFETQRRDEIKEQVLQDTILDISIEEEERPDDSQHLRAEVVRLRNELDGLKENVIIESMRDMKENYVHLRAKYKTLCSQVSCKCKLHKMTTKNRSLIKSIIALERSSKLLLKEFADIIKVICKPFKSVHSAEWEVLQELCLHVHHIILHNISLTEELDCFDDDLEVSCVCDNIRRGSAAPLHGDEDYDYLDTDTDESSADSDARD